MKLDMRAVLGNFTDQTLTVHSHPTAPTYTNGRLNPASPTTRTVAAAVQPSGGRDVLRLPEGLRAREVVTVWCVEDLVAAVEDGPKGDRFEWKGKTYEVQVLKTWASAGGFCEAVCTRVPYGGS